MNLHARLKQIDREWQNFVEFGEVPIDSCPKIRTPGELASDLSRDKRFLLVENAQLKQAYAHASVENYRLRKQLGERPTWAWIFGVAAGVFLVTTILLLIIEGRL